MNVNCRNNCTSKQNVNANPLGAPKCKVRKAWQFSLVHIQLCSPVPFRTTVSNQQ